jgi:hypothetical protein
LCETFHLNTYHDWILDSFNLSGPIPIRLAGQQDGLGSAGSDGSARFRSSVEEVATDPDDFSLHLPDSGKCVRMKRVRPGGHAVDLSHQIGQFRIAFIMINNKIIFILINGNLCSIF